VANRLVLPNESSATAWITLDLYAMTAVIVLGVVVGSKGRQNKDSAKDIECLNFISDSETFVC
jgi:hypothetical protein